MFEERRKIQENFRQEMLNTHNYLRQLHGVPPLILDDQLTANAQTHADYLAQQDIRPMHSNRKGRLGENLYSTTARDPIHRPDGKSTWKISSRRNNENLCQSSRWNHSNMVQGNNQL